jgi:hypothetical protein
MQIYQSVSAVCAIAMSVGFVVESYNFLLNDDEFGPGKREWFVCCQEWQSLSF